MKLPAHFPPTPFQGVRVDINTVLISNGFINVTALDSARDDNHAAIGTILSNLAHFGFIPSVDALNALRTLSDFELGEFWGSIREALREVTGANRNMDRFVVYKNFPAEVLDMSQAQYWFSQVLMYWGVPSPFFTQTEKAREPLNLKERNLKVLALAAAHTPTSILANLARCHARWTDDQRAQADFLLLELVPPVLLDQYGFKENAIHHAAIMVERNRSAYGVGVDTATDVARLMAAMSQGDISLRTRVQFRRFSRPERQALLNLLEGCRNIEEDMARRPGLWKRIMHALRPGDYKACWQTIAACGRLYMGLVKSYSSRIEKALVMRDASVLALLQERPGEFVRRFHKLYALFGTLTVDAFLGVVDRLSTLQLLRIDRYVRTINDRDSLVYAPRGNWMKAQIATNQKVKIATEDRARLRRAIVAVIRDRLAAKFPEGFDVSDQAENVRLQTNDQKLAPYGRGTVFDIPQDVKFIRSASYWEAKAASNIWYDNGWNFFDADWKSKGVCCWDENRVGNAAVFSGDPCNVSEVRGRACQMIDLYPEKLLERGIRYAVWNILCFSSLSFDMAEDVLATLQWGEDAQSGKLFEPSRCQMVFPVRGANLTKYIAYVDLVERKLIYADANLRGRVNSASANSTILEETFPPFVEYLKSLPTVADLFRTGKPGVLPVLYSDEGVDVENEHAYVFLRRNPKNEFQGIDLSSVLGE